MEPMIQTAKPLKKRRSLRFKILASLAFALLLVVACVFFITGTSPGQALLARTVSSPATSSAGGFKISGISGILSGTTRIDRIALSDSEGTYASISDAEIDWRRTALFSLTFDASRITAGKVEILRQPQPSAEKSEGSAGLPIQLDLRDIDLPQVHLGEELVGTAQDIRLQAHLSARRDIAAISGGFKIMPEGREGNIAGDFEFDTVTGAARLDSVLEEPPGGLLATAFDLPGKPAVNITAKVEGSLDAARFSLRGNAGGENAIDISGTGGLSGEKFNISASGNGTPSLIVPEKFRELLAGRLTLDVDVAGSTEGHLNVKTARIDASNFYAVLRGTLDTQGTSDLSGGLVAKNAGVDIRGAINEGLAALTVKSVAFSVKGPSDKAEIALSADVPMAGTNEALLSGIRAVASSPAMDLSERKGKFSLRFEADKAKFDNPDLQRMFPGRTYGEASGRIDGRQAIMESLSVSNEALKLTGDAAANLDNGDASGNLALVIGGRFLPASVNQVSSEDLEASAKFEALAGGGFRVTDLTLTKGNDKASGSAEIIDGTIDASLTAAFNSLKSLTPDFDGALNIEAMLSGPVSAPSTTVNVTADRIDANGHHISDLKATLSGVADMAKPDLDFELSGDIDSLPLTGSARLLAKPEGRVLEDLNLVNGNNRISGNIVVKESGLAQGELSVQLPEIGPLAALAGQDIKGGISGNIVFSGSSDAPLISANLASVRVSREQLAAEGITADIKIRDYMTSPGVEGSVKLDGVRQGTTSIDALRANFALDGDWTSFDVTGRTDGSPVAATGRVKSSNGTTSIELAKVSDSYRGVAAARASPTNIQVLDGVA
jgi:translocation and assembly module TamB